MSESVSPSGSVSGPSVPRVSLALWKLRLSMIGTIAVITGISSLVLLGILSYLGISFYGLYGILGFVAFFHVFQWLIGPYLIKALYRVRSIEETEYQWIRSSVESLSLSSGLRSTPKVMIANIDIPNAFAYGSPLTGPMVAVTRGLVKELPREEVEAVISHELGHLKHRDVLVMLMISIIPAVVYWLGHMLYISGWFGGAGSRGRGGNAGGVLFIGMALMMISFILNLFVFQISRLREYYADSHAAVTARDGARNLQRALVRIMRASGKVVKRGEEMKAHGQLKMFFIADPEKGIEGYGDVDSLVEKVKSEKPSRFLELFSTHPHPAKRLRHLDRFIQQA